MEVAVFTWQIISDLCLSFFSWTFSSAQDFGTLLAGVGAAIAALTWRLQLSTQLKIDFLDKLDTAIKDYIFSLEKSFATFDAVFTSSLQSNTNLDELITHWKEMKKEKGKSITSVIIECEAEVKPRLEELLKLKNKGQYFKLSNYDDFSAMLTSVINDYRNLITFGNLVSIKFNIENAIVSEEEEMVLWAKNFSLDALRKKLFSIQCETESYLIEWQSKLLK